MAVDIGSEAIYGGGSSVGHSGTLINNIHPATQSGIITKVDAYAHLKIANLFVGTFYPINGNTFKCRDSQNVGSITAGGKRTKSASLAVEIGDYIGCYFTSGSIERKINTFGDWWKVVGEHKDPGDEATYTLFEEAAISLGGYIGVNATILAPSAMGNGVAFAPIIVIENPISVTISYPMAVGSGKTFLPIITAEANVTIQSPLASGVGSAGSPIISTEFYARILRIYTNMALSKDLNITSTLSLTKDLRITSNIVEK